MAEKCPKRGELWQHNVDEEFIVMATGEVYSNVFEGVTIRHADKEFIGLVCPRWGIRYFHKFSGTLELKQD